MKKGPFYHEGVQMPLKGKTQMLDPVDNDYMLGAMLNSKYIKLDQVPVLRELTVYLRKYKYNMLSATKDISMR